MSETITEVLINDSAPYDTEQWGKSIFTMDPIDMTTDNYASFHVGNVWYTYLLVEIVSVWANAIMDCSQMNEAPLRKYVNSQPRTVSLPHVANTLVPWDIVYEVTSEYITLTKNASFRGGSDAEQCAEVIAALFEAWTTSSDDWVLAPNGPQVLVDKCATMAGVDLEEVQTIILDENNRYVDQTHMSAIRLMISDEKTLNDIIQTRKPRQAMVNDEPTLTTPLPTDSNLDYGLAQCLWFGAAHYQTVPNTFGIYLVAHRLPDDLLTGEEGNDIKVLGTFENDLSLVYVRNACNTKSPNVYIGRSLMEVGTHHLKGHFVAAYAPWREAVLVSARATWLTVFITFSSLREVQETIYLLHNTDPHSTRRPDVPAPPVPPVRPSRPWLDPRVRFWLFNAALISCGVLIDRFFF